MTFQVISRFENKGKSLSVEVSISSRQASSLNTILSLAGINRRQPASPWGWDFDSHTGTALITVPWMYRGKIENALRMMQRKWHPGFQTAAEMKEAMV